MPTKEEKQAQSETNHLLAALLAEQRVTNFLLFQMIGDNKIGLEQVEIAKERIDQIVRGERRQARLNGGGLTPL